MARTFSPYSILNVWMQNRAQGWWSGAVVVLVVLVSTQYKLRRRGSGQATAVCSSRTNTWLPAHSRYDDFKTGQCCCVLCWPCAAMGGMTTIFNAPRELRLPDCVIPPAKQLATPKFVCTLHHNNSTPVYRQIHRQKHRGECGMD
jgi:hypothetical protein